ncbi:transposase [Imperialibacter sp. EC-SDR9]|nr:transposase [Imperialibacter sp. 89]VVT33480.1 transposase [Imperialibacter sp. EC-SDR9]
MAAIFREYGGNFIARGKLSIDQLKAYNAICSCRTSAMGGHVDSCDKCGHCQVSYNSCRNRHCNKCQYTKQLVWVDKLRSALPVCRYFHVVFTIPSQLQKTFYINQRECYKLLFQASAETLLKVGRNPKFLGAETGAVSVLHTWGQALTYHPHIHMLVPAGGLSEDGVEWVNAGKKFFLPVKVLSSIFRGVLWDKLKSKIESGHIKLADNFSDTTTLKAALYAKNWHVYIKKPLAGPESVVQYLGKYTHRVAISNSRLVSASDGKVTFRWKNYRQRLANQLLSLDVQEFIGRFMRHILPSGFYKIRYYGLLAPANRPKKQQCMSLIGKDRPVSLLQGLKAKQVLAIVTGKNPDICPKCLLGQLIPKTILDPV